MIQFHTKLKTCRLGKAPKWHQVLLQGSEEWRARRGSLGARDVNQCIFYYGEWIEANAKKNTEGWKQWVKAYCLKYTWRWKIWVHRKCVTFSYLFTWMYDLKKCFHTWKLCFKVNGWKQGKTTFFKASVSLKIGGFSKVLPFSIFLFRKMIWKRVSASEICVVIRLWYHPPLPLRVI